MTALDQVLGRAKLLRLPQQMLDGYVVKVDPKEPDGFIFVSRNETVNLEGGEDFVTIERAALEHLIQRKPVEFPPGIPALTSGERAAVGETISIKQEARRVSNGNQKVYLREMRRISRGRILEMEAKVKEDDDEQAQVEKSIRVHSEVRAWLALPLVLERPEGSALHKLQRAHRDGEWFMVRRESERVLPIDGVMEVEELQSFVVEHEWAKVLAGSEVTGTGGEIRLGSDASAFEFIVSGRRVIATVMQKDFSGRSRLGLNCQFEGGWGFLCPYDLNDSFEPIPTMDIDIALRAQPLADLIARNIKAICIMLEAEVAQTEVVRVDARLNRAREKRGKLPLTDYHVVSLVRRERVLPRSGAELDPDRDVTRRRMHFRRGHWRHYQDHRTWIKWMLVGDPDLGFVDKHYKL